MSRPLEEGFRALAVLSAQPGWEVLLAEHRPTGERVVLRALKGGFADEPLIVACFIEAARRVKELDHPYAAAVLGHSPPSDRPSYWVLERYEGESLQGWLDRGALPAGPSGARDVLTPLLLALMLAEVLMEGQRRGVVHGALHPGQVLLVPDAGAPFGHRVRLLGLGMGAVRVLGSEQWPGSVPLPPPRYRPPELSVTRAGDGPSDVYALGRVLGRMLEVGGLSASQAPTLAPMERSLLGDLEGLLARMLREVPAERAPMAEVRAELLRIAESAQQQSARGALLLVRQGQVVGRYRLGPQLAGGGMGVVFEARELDSGRRAAVKVLRPELSQDPEMVRRFFREAESARALRHPGIVEVYDYGQLPERVVYIAMEFLDGESLHRRLSRCGGRLGAGAVGLLQQVAAALTLAHRQGVVHRDLKPENIMIVPGPGGERSKLLDFGIAKVAGGVSGPSTQAGQTMGTPVYMAPEQSQDAGSVTDRADVYSLGVVLFEVLAGQPPFSAAMPAELASLHLYAPPPPLRGLAPEVPEALARLVAAMLEKDPARRPAMAEVAARL